MDTQTTTYAEQMDTALATIDRLNDTVTLERGGYDGRYNIKDGDTLLGWVIREGSTWAGFVAADVNRHTESVAGQIARGYAREVGGWTRHEAIDNMLTYLVIRAGYAR